MSDQEREHLALIERVTNSHIVLIEALLSQAKALIEITRLHELRQKRYASHMKLTKHAGGE